MSYNVVPSVVTGQTYPASSYNTYVKGNFDAMWIYTTLGDLVYAASASALTRLGIGVNKLFLQSNGSAPVWASLLAGRKGNSPTDWSQPGTTTYSPTGAIVQTGVARIAMSGTPPSGTVAVTFPVVFGQKPIILISQNFTGGTFAVMQLSFTTPSTTGFTLQALFGSTPASYTDVDVHWLALGEP